jgi:hypothetical protein
MDLRNNMRSVVKLFQKDYKRKDGNTKTKRHTYETLKQSGETDRDTPIAMDEALFNRLGFRLNDRYKNNFSALRAEHIIDEIKQEYDSQKPIRAEKCEKY